LFAGPLMFQVSVRKCHCLPLGLTLAVLLSCTAEIPDTPREPSLPAVEQTTTFRPTAALATVTADDADVFYRTGPLGTLAAMQAVHPHMAAQGWGRIVNVGSAVGVTGFPGYGVYGASKEAIRSLTRTAAREWGRDGIVVNCICPGAASQRGLDAAARDEAAHLEHMKMHPIGRMGDPEDDIAPVVQFLLSDASRYLTGQTLMVDGGGTLFA